MAGRGGVAAAGKSREGRTKSDPWSELLSIRPRYNTIKKAPPRGLGTRLAVTDAPAHRPTILREDGGVMPTEHRPERREAGGGRECGGGGGAIMAPHFPTNSSGAYLFRWHGGGGGGGGGRGAKGNNEGGRAATAANGEEETKPYSSFVRL